MNADHVAAILALFDTDKARAWRTAYHVDADAVPHGWVPLDQRGTVHELIAAGIMHIDSVDNWHTLFLDEPDYDTRSICLCGTNTYGDAAPFDAAHWMTPTSSTAAIYSCSEPCGNRIEALRDKRGILSIAGLFDARRRSPGLSSDRPA